MTMFKLETMVYASEDGTSSVSGQGCCAGYPVCTGALSAMEKAGLTIRLQVSETRRQTKRKREQKVPLALKI